jgi:DNA-binding PadR family transcriptional regulator
VLELAILGLLKDQPLHGYELKKRLGETLGFLWGVSYGSLYPALRRLERSRAIEIVEPGAPEPGGGPPMPATGSISGETAAARFRRLAKPTRRNRKQYRLTPHGDALFAELLAADAPNADEEKAFALRFAFCRHLPRQGRVELLERRRADLTDRLTRARRARAGRGDRYTRSLMEHRTKSTERDLEWVDDLIATERRAVATPTQEGATAS